MKRLEVLLLPQTVRRYYSIVARVTLKEFCRGFSNISLAPFVQIVAPYNLKTPATQATVPFVEKKHVKPSLSSKDTTRRQGKNQYWNHQLSATLRSIKPFALAWQPGHLTHRAVSKFALPKTFFKNIRFAITIRTFYRFSEEGRRKRIKDIRHSEIKIRDFNRFRVVERRKTHRWQRNFFSSCDHWLDRTLSTTEKVERAREQ